MKILVPVRYPLGENSISTLKRAVEIADERDASLIVLHIDLFQDSKRVETSDLRREVESKMGKIDAHYSVREGFLVEESILQEAASRDTDMIVIGRTQTGRWRRALRRMIGNSPDIERFLRERLEAEIHVVS
ncbi:MAG: universal stress protein [Halobacteria archaeon]|nr:universal stress protein [Halobacteria archaeon]